MSKHEHEHEHEGEGEGWGRETVVHSHPQIA
jgi:hypothetical protein